MCRSIKQLRNAEQSTSELEITEAALQYVRKISGFRKPSRANSSAFEAAVRDIAAATQRLLQELESGNHVQGANQVSE